MYDPIAKGQSERGAGEGVHESKRASIHACVLETSLIQLFFFNCVPLYILVDILKRYVYECFSPHVCLCTTYVPGAYGG